MYRYYSLRRMQVPGGIPRGVVGIVEFDDKRYCPEIERDAWGYVEYAKPLTPQEIIMFELAVPVGDGCSEDGCSF